MDTLVGFLDGPRARGAFLLRSVLEPPWSMRIQDEAPLTVVAVVRGEAWIMPGEGDAERFEPGDLVAVRGPDPYVVADSSGTPPGIVIHPGQVCTTLDGESVAETMGLGVRTWGNSAHGSTVLLTGTYQATGEVSRRLLEALPRLVILRAGDWDCPFVPLLADEIGKDEPGQAAVLDRLLDVLVVAMLRTWFARADVTAPAWYAAYADPVVGRAVRMLQDDPAQPWTVGSLASSVGVSRAALARRFTDLVGEPPMTFLSSWRLTLAADLLREPDATVTSVARKVGYTSPFTFSAAFKRHHGISPNAYRNRDQGAAIGSARPGAVAQPVRAADS